MNRFEKLHSERTKKGMTHASMAQLLGISKAYYCQIENRNRRLSYNMAYKIGKILGFKPDDLFYGEVKNSLIEDSE